MKYPNRDRLKRERALQMRLLGLTYGEIGKELGVSRQRVQQLICPPPKIRDIVLQRANGCCEDCGVKVGKVGHIHHKGGNGEDYNDIENLELLCIPCHLTRHCPTYGGLSYANRNAEIVALYRSTEHLPYTDRQRLGYGRLARRFGVSRACIEQIVKAKR